MELFLHIYLLVVGLVLGSFYNVVGIRTAEGRSIVTPRSHCGNCKRTLSAMELIPVLSYVMQKGRCKGCGTKVSMRYPLFELVTACLFTISPLMVGWSKELLIAFLLLSLLVIIVISDVHAMLIPNKVLLFFACVIIPVRFFIPMDPWWDPIAGSIVGFVLLLFIAIISKGGMGGGDIKLFAVLGLFLGLKGVLLTFFFATFIGAFVGIVLVVLKKVKRKQPIPFGPAISAGALITYFYGDVIWNMYIGMF